MTIPDLPRLDSLHSRRIALEGANINIPAMRTLIVDMKAAGFLTNAATMERRLRHYEEELDAMPDEPEQAVRLPYTDN